MIERMIDTFSASDFNVIILSNKTIVRKDRSGFAGHISGNSVLEFDSVDQGGLKNILSTASDAMNAHPSDRWSLGLPLKYFNIVNFSLPSAALENLDDAVKFALMRHVPYDPDQAHISYQMSKRDNSLDISSMIILKKSIPPFLQAASAAGINFCSIFPSMIYWARLKGDGVYVCLGQEYGEVLVHAQGRIVMHNWGKLRPENASDFLKESSRLLANIAGMPKQLYLVDCQLSGDQICTGLSIDPEEVEVLRFDSGIIDRSSTFSQGYVINLISGSAAKQQMFYKYLTSATVIFFMLGFFALPASNLAGKKKYLAGIESHIEAGKEHARELTQLRTENRLLFDNLESMFEIKNSYPPVIDILRELTEAIPESAWLHTLELSGMKITLQGEAVSATQVIEAVENSGMFQSVRFTSPVIRSGNKERFGLAAEVVL